MNVKNLILGIGMVIVFALVLWQGIETFYPSPQSEDFCDYSKGYEQIYNISSCELAGGKWVDDAYPRPAIDNKTVTGYCNVYFSCNAEHEEARKSYSWKVFIASLVVGIILLLIGFFINLPDPLGSSLIGSAVWAISWGSVINWRNFGSAWRFILLIIALALLIGISLKINRKKEDKDKSEK